MCGHQVFLERGFFMEKKKSVGLGASEQYLIMMDQDATVYRIGWARMAITRSKRKRGEMIQKEHM